MKKLTALALCLLFLFQTASLASQPQRDGGDKTVYVIDVSRFSADEQILVTALQGIVNRTGPRVFLKPGNISVFSQVEASAYRTVSDAFSFDTLQRYSNTEDVWIQYYAQQYGCVFEEASLPDVFAQFARLFDGAVLFDRAQNGVGAPLSVASMSGDMLPVSQSLLERYDCFNGLAIREDLTIRGFQNELETQEWVFDKYGAGASRDFAGSVFDSGLENGITQNDLVVQKGGVVFHLDASKEGLGYDAEPTADEALLTAIYQRMNPLGIVWGWGGPDEVAITRRVTEQGLTLVCGNMPNGSFFACFDGKNAEPFFQPLPDPETITLENKIYVAFLTNEGDTYKYFAGLGNMGAWLQKDRGEIPVSWGMDPAVMELFPSMAAYYYGTRAKTDCFFSAPAGYGYIHPSVLPEEYRSLFAQKVKSLNEKYCLHHSDMWWFPTEWGYPWVGSMGFDSLSLWQDAMKTVYENGGSLPVIHSNHYYLMEKACKRFSPDRAAAVVAEYMKEQAAEIRRDKPFFTLMYAGDPASFKRVADALPSDRFAFVTVDELYALAAQAKREGRDNPQDGCSKDFETYLQSVPGSMPAFDLTQPADIASFAGADDSIGYFEPIAMQGQRQGAVEYRFSAEGVTVAPRGSYFAIASTVAKPMDLSKLGKVKILLTAHNANPVVKVMFNQQQIYAQNYVLEGNGELWLTLPPEVVESAAGKQGSVSFQLGLESNGPSPQATFHKIKLLTGDEPDATPYDVFPGDSRENPILLRTSQDLLDMAYQPDKHYRVDDAAGLLELPDGYEAFALAGSFDGNGKILMTDGLLSGASPLFASVTGQAGNLTVLCYGDANEDGVANALDAIQVKRYILKGNGLGGYGMLSADLNRDGQVDILDLVRLKRRMAGISE